MYQLRYEELHPQFGASVRGTNLGKPLTPDLIQEINAAINQYSFVCFPDQSMDDDHQLALTRQFGNPEPSHTSVGQIEYFGTIGNVQKDGTVLGSSHKKTIFLTGNNMWHSDASFKPVPAFLSIMCAYETPAEGGTTMFLSLRAAYDRLSPERKAELHPLIAIHDYVYSRSKIAPDAVSPEMAASLPPVRQRLVRTNPTTGAKNLFLGSHVREIEGMSQAAGRALIDELTEAASQPEHIYVHAWQPGDVVLWDNRCLLHVLDVGGGWLVERIVTLRIAERKKPASRIWLWEKGRNDAAVVFGFCLVGRKDLDQEPCGGAGTHSPSSSERRTLEPGFQSSANTS